MRNSVLIASSEGIGSKAVITCKAAAVKSMVEDIVVHLLCMSRAILGIIIE